jgi:hypothetical protein
MCGFGFAVAPSAWKVIAAIVALSGRFLKPKPLSIG